MQGILYEESSVLAFLFVTVLVGGATAWMTGRACARTWRPQIVLFLYILLLGAAVRFVHFTVFGGTLRSLQFYVADTLILMAIGFFAFRHTRTTQMVTQYHWLNERTGLVSWRARR